MTKSKNITPILQEGMAYSLRMKDGRKICNVIYYACVASGKPYFGKGNKIYPVEDVHSHSLLGHNVPDNYQEPDHSDPDDLVITDDDGDTIDIQLTPSVTPDTFPRKVRCLMLSGLSQEEAEKDVAKTPIQMELFYDVGRGLFAIEADAIGCTPLYNPYTGKEIPDKTT